ncbi:MAG: phosphoenolpyruvate hydrolase family protein [Planctomycetota bacterium]|nr:phosphoenolpyruvate hydrolase family protein [Planctomycetota bacterium]
MLEERGVTEPTVDNSRAAILARFREQIARGEPIIGGGAGTGLSAKSEEAGGIDLIIIYNSGRYRMAGRGSTAGLMPYGNANQIVKEMAFEVIPVVQHTPVLAGVCGTDPFMMPKLFLRELQELGFAGIQNFPTVGLIEGRLRHTLEETGMGYGLEVDIVALAREMDMLTTPYVFNTDEARRMTEAGADIVVAHMGCTSGGSIGAETVTPLDDCILRIQEIVETCKSIRDDVILLCHGGPIAMPDDAAYIIERVEGIDGFYGASSTERFPTEVAIREQVERFKSIRLSR